jgi:hypothetical protein
MSGTELLGNQNLHRLVEQFFSRISKRLLRLGVGQHDPPRAIHNDHGVRRCFQQTAKFFISVSHAFIVVGSGLPGRN